MRWMVVPSGPGSGCRRRPGSPRRCGAVGRRWAADRRYKSLVGLGCGRAPTRMRTTCGLPRGGQGSEARDAPGRARTCCRRRPTSPIARFRRRGHRPAGPDDLDVELARLLDEEGSAPADDPRRASPVLVETQGVHPSPARRRRRRADSPAGSPVPWRIQIPGQQVVENAAEWLRNEQVRQLVHQRVSSDTHSGVVRSREDSGVRRCSLKQDPQRRGLVAGPGDGERRELRPTRGRGTQAS